MTPEERLVDDFITSRGRLLVCSYGSSRPEGTRAELRVDELRSWGLPVADVHDVVSPEHGFVITRVVALRRDTARTGTDRTQ